MHFERQNSFQNAENYFVFQKKRQIKEYVCLPCLNFSDPFPKTDLFFIFSLSSPRKCMSHQMRFLCICKYKATSDWIMDINLPWDGYTVRLSLTSLVTHQILFDGMPGLA